MEKNQIKLFNDKRIRVKWDQEIEDYYFSIIDIVGVISESKNPSAYWRKLKQRLSEESNETVTKCHKLKMPAKDGKMRLTDVANTKEILRIIQSIPSPNAEPFKQWLAQLGQERLDEIADPQKAFERAVETYRKKGYSEKWIEERLQATITRNKLTAEWNRVGVKEGIEYVILTDDISNAWSGMTTKEYKEYKGLKKEGLRDNMTDIELILNRLAEASTTEISKVENPDGFEESRNIAKRGGNIAGNARKELELNTGKSVISKVNSHDNKKILESKKEK